MFPSDILSSHNPCTDEIIWQAPVATPADIDQMVSAARFSFNQWRHLSFEVRAGQVIAYRDYIVNHATELAKIISAETGKPYWEAQTEVSSVAAKIDISIAAHRARTGDSETIAAGARQVLRHHPHGILIVLGPYNFPAHLPNGHIVPALLAGNALIFKPSEMTPASGAFLVAAWAKSGGDPHLVQLAVGNRTTGIALTTHADIDGVLFTGSVPTGIALHKQFAGQPEKMLALEMGGNNPLIVWDADNLDAAIATTLQSAFISAGQRCTCARRLILPDTHWGYEFAGLLAKRAAILKIGAPHDDPPSFMGPVINNAAADMLMRAQETLLKKGGQPILAMTRPIADRPFLTPGLIDVSRVSDNADEEYFGPLLQIYFVADFKAAIAQANNTRFGLAAGLISDDENNMTHFMAEIKAGIVNWNQPLTGASSAAPFGGVGLSGNHRPSAYYAADYCAYPVASLLRDAVVVPANIPGISK
jgi:succinylglutamic semialdehyde dehydrogenase